jgi:hypothetical protein
MHTNLSEDCADWNASFKRIPVTSHDRESDGLVGDDSVFLSIKSEKN